MTKLTNEERFWLKVDKDGPLSDYAPELGKCWIWKGAKNNWNYGTFYLPSFTKNSTSAHRVSYHLCGGEIPAGRYLDHLCRVTLCVNPAHLEPVSNSENLQRVYRTKGQMSLWE
jgi:hypothetical protein